MRVNGKKEFDNGSQQNEETLARLQKKFTCKN
jgi:hypothetical protein